MYVSLNSKYIKIQCNDYNQLCTDHKEKTAGKDKMLIFQP